MGNADVEVFQPGHFIQDELRRMNWTPMDLAAKMGQTTPFVRRILEGQQSITGDIAAALAKALGKPAEDWLVLQRIYDDFMAETQPNLQGATSER